MNKPSTQPLATISVQKNLRKILPMKTKLTNSLLPLLCAAILGTLPSAFAQRIWDGGGGNNTWTNAANWGGTAPVATNTLTFSGTTQLTNVNNFTAGTVFNSIDFSAGAGAFNITGNAIGMNTAGTLTNNSSNDQILNLAITGLGGSSLITTGAGADITIGALNGTATLNKRGLGTLTLGASSYSGVTTIGVAAGGDAGTVRFTGNKTANANAVNIFAGTLDINGNTFNATTLTLGNGTVGTSGNVLVGTGGVLNLTAITTIASTVTHTITGGTINLNNATRTFAVADGGAATDLEVSSVIANGNGTSSITKSGTTSTLLLSGNNTYTGVTLVGGGGTLAVNTLADGGLASGVGASTNAASNLLMRQGTTLSYRGTSNASTDRLFTVDGQNAAETATISSDGNGTVSFTNTGSLAFGTANQTRTFILGGTNTGNNTFAPTVADNGTGAVSVTKNGTGSWILSGANSYNGTTTVNTGVLNIQNASALGTTTNGTSVISGAALQIQGNITVGAEALTLRGTGLGNDGALRNIAGSNTYGGLVTLGAAARINSDAGSLTLSNTGTITGATFGLTVGGAGDTTIASIIGTTTGTLTKDGTGTVTLTGANTYTGATVVGAAGGSNAGTLRVSGSGTIGTGNTTATVTVNAGDLDLNGTTQKFSNASALIMGNGTAGSTANVLIGSGSLILGGNIAFVSGSVANGATISGIGGGTLSLGGASRVFSANDSSNAPVDLTISAIIINGGASSNISKNGAGVLLLSGANTYTGATLVNAGALVVTNLTDNTSDNALGRGTAGASGLQLSNNTVLSYAGSANATTNRSFTIAGSADGHSATVSSDGAGSVSFTSTGSIAYGTANQTRTLNLAGTNTGNNTLRSNLANNGTGAVSVTKSGAGQWTLSGNSSYTGATTINQGTLVVAAGGSLASGSAVAVNSTGTLGGTGTVNGAVTVNSGGTLSPGNSPGLQTLGSLVLNDGGNYNWQMLDADGAAGTGYDSYTLTGALDLSNLTGVTDFNINLWSLSSIGPDVNGNALNFNNAVNKSWTIVATNSVITGFDASYFTVNVGAINGTGGFTNGLGFGAFTVELGDSNTDLLLTYTVPEPSTWVLLALGFTAIVALRRRRLC